MLYKPILRGGTPDAMFLHHFGPDRSYYQGNAQRDEYQVVMISQHRNEIRDQLNGRQRVRHHSNSKGLVYQGTRGSRLDR